MAAAATRSASGRASPLVPTTFRWRGRGGGSPAPLGCKAHVVSCTPPRGDAPRAKRAAERCSAAPLPRRVQKRCDPRTAPRRQCSNVAPPHAAPPRAAATKATNASASCRAATNFTVPPTNRLQPAAASLPSTRRGPPSPPRAASDQGQQDARSGGDECARRRRTCAARPREGREGRGRTAVANRQGRTGTASRAIRLEGPPRDARSDATPRYRRRPTFLCGAKQRCVEESKPLIPPQPRPSGREGCLPPTPRRRARGPVVRRAHHVRRSTLLSTLSRLESHHRSQLELAPPLRRRLPGAQARGTRGGVARSCSTTMSLCHGRALARTSPPAKKRRCERNAGARCGSCDETRRPSFAYLGSRATGPSAK